MKALRSALRFLAFLLDQLPGTPTEPRICTGCRKTVRFRLPRRTERAAMRQPTWQPSPMPTCPCGGYLIRTGRTWPDTTDRQEAW